MARDSVVVKGVTLTKADVDYAVAELAKPAPTACLSLVQLQKKDGGVVRGVVITGPMLQAYATLQRFPADMRYSVVHSGGLVAAYQTDEGLLADWTVTGVLSNDAQAQQQAQVDGGGVK